MSEVYFIGDLHAGHKNICKFRQQFESEEQHFQHMKEVYHTIVTKRDRVFFMGDTAFTKERLRDIATWVGHKTAILGNHDLEKECTIRDYVEAFDDVQGFMKYKEFWLSHAPIHPNELRGKINIHGHCVDSETEILTKDGWARYSDVFVGQEVVSLNTDGVWEWDKIKLVTLHENYRGDAYHVKTKGLDMLLSNQHRVLFLDKKGVQTYEAAEKALGRSNLRIVKAALPLDESSIPLSDDMLRLYVWLAADGNITPSKLCRVRLKKTRKIEKLQNLLSSLGVKYNCLTYKNGMVCLNFKLPVELEDWNIKGLDNRLIKASVNQCGIIKSTYQETDGNRDLIFTSKKSEVDILQTMFVLNGYSCKVHAREGHGFSSKTSYQLSVTQNPIHLIGNVKKQTEKILYSGIMWCVTTNNSNFLARRNGSVFFTGNCHYATIDDDRYFNTSLENIGYRPISLQEIRKIVHKGNT